MTYRIGDCIRHSVLTIKELPPGARHIYCQKCDRPVAIITAPLSKIDDVLDQHGSDFNRYDNLTFQAVMDCATSLEFRDVSAMVQAHEESHAPKKKKQGAST